MKEIIRVHKTLKPSCSKQAAQFVNVKWPEEEGIVLREASITKGLKSYFVEHNCSSKVAQALMTIN